MVQEPQARPRADVEVEDDAKRMEGRRQGADSAGGRVHRPLEALEAFDGLDTEIRGLGEFRLLDPAQRARPESVRR